MYINVADLRLLCAVILPLRHRAWSGRHHLSRLHSWYQMLCILVHWLNHVMGAWWAHRTQQSRFIWPVDLKICLIMLVDLWSRINCLLSSPQRMHDWLHSESLYSIRILNFLFCLLHLVRLMDAKRSQQASSLLLLLNFLLVNLAIKDA